MARKVQLWYVIIYNIYIYITLADDIGVFLIYSSLLRSFTSAFMYPHFLPGTPPSLPAWYPSLTSCLVPLPHFLPGTPPSLPAWYPSLTSCLVPLPHFLPGTPPIQCMCSSYLMLLFRPLPHITGYYGYCGYCVYSVGKSC